ncbi:MAG: enoyl-CoA hydratase/isomerase family protein [Thermodesulfobacteriota bacterium]
MNRITWTMEEGRVAVVTLNDGENRFNPLFLESFLSVLDKVEKETGARALLVTSGHDKIFSNGIDLDWLVPVIQGGRKEEAKAFFYRMMGLFRRILLYPMPTIAAVSGHAFAGGAILCCAFDFRFMRSDRGFFCFPEVDLGIPFLPGMIAIITRAITLQTFEEMQYTGRRLTAEACVEKGIVAGAYSSDELMGRALNFAVELDKRREVVLEMKRRTHKRIVRVLDQEDPPIIESGMFSV